MCLLGSQACVFRIGMYGLGLGLKVLGHQRCKLRGLGESGLFN